MLNEDAEQFDEALDRRVWSLSDQRLKWDLEMALKRRGVPQEVEELMRDLIAQQRAYDDGHRPEEEENMDLDDTEDQEGESYNVLGGYLLMFPQRTKRTSEKQRILSTS